MALSTALWNTGLNPSIIHDSTSKPEDNASRGVSPVPSITNSVTTVDPDSETEGRMGNALPIRAHQLPLSNVTKHYDRTVYSAGGRQQPSGDPSVGGAVQGRSSHADPQKPCETQNGNNSGRGEDGDGSDEGTNCPRQSPTQEAATEGPLEREKRYACPYRKRNPVHFNIRDHKGCSYEPFSDLAGLK